MLEAMNLAYAVNGNDLVDGFSLSVALGKFVAIVGPNGAGKTTALRMLSGELTPTRGTVLFQGKDIRRQAPRALARERACFSQCTAGAFPFIVREIAAMGRHPHLNGMYESRHDDELVTQAMRAAGIEPLAGRRYPTLSGGEATRTHFARTIAQEPRLLLLDEPTNHLDMHHQQAVLRHCRGMADRKECAVVAVLHDLNLASYFSDEIVVLREGRSVAQGAPADVIDADLLEAVYDMKCEIWRHPSGSPWAVPLIDTDPFPDALSSTANPLTLMEANG